MRQSAELLLLRVWTTLALESPSEQLREYHQCYFKAVDGMLKVETENSLSILRPT